MGRQFRFLNPGDRFTRWTAVSPIGTGGKMWLCRCDCGTERPVRKNALLSRLTNSCGCLPSDIRKGIVPHMDLLAKAGITREQRTRWGRRSHLKQTYGLTIDQYDAMLASQGGVCAVCRKFETRKGRDGRVRYLSVDHDHRTGTIRGLLCYLCNSAIGAMADDPERLIAAAGYLRTDGVHGAQRRVAV